MPEHTPEKQRGWDFPAFRSQSYTAGLYIVSTPIGNMGDISFRALDTLAGVDAVLCEDTRMTGKLLSYYGIRKKLEVYNDHSEEGRRGAIADRIAAGQALALVSDAGMPLISDPGYKLVAELRRRGLRVTSVPGANAPLMALQLSGLPSDKFAFIGFLPPKSAARRAALEEWSRVPASLIAFETAPRLETALEDIAAVMGEDRRVAVCRELTKMFEEALVDTPRNLIAHYAAKGAPRGEIVLVIERADEAAASVQDVDELLIAALEHMSTKDAAAFVSAQTGMPKKEIYARALEVGRG